MPFKDLEMMQFTCARLREFGKQGMHHSQLLLVLRAVSQQVSVIGVAMEPGA